MAGLPWGSRGPKYLADTELRVYLRTPEVPGYDDVIAGMHRYVSDREVALIGTDVRLSISVARARQNEDLFTDNRIDRTLHFVRIRYLSEQRLVSRAHLTFAFQAARVYALLGDGPFTYDSTGDRWWRTSELDESLAEAPTISDFGRNVQTEVGLDDDTRYLEARTFGLRKVGHPELVISRVPGDMKVLLGEIATALATQVWESPEWAAQREVSLYDDAFIVRMSRAKGGLVGANIVRVQSK